MKSLSRRAFLGSRGAAAGSTAVAATVLGRWGRDGNNEAGSAVTARGEFPNVWLRTHENRKVRFYDDLLKGKSVLISFIFTACKDLCPMTTINLKEVQDLMGDRVGRDLFFYSISLDPEHDTPFVRAEYASAFQVGPGWEFLTGKKDDVESLRRAFGLVDPDPVIDADPEQHIGMVWHGIEPLHRWAASPALTSPAALVQYVSWLDPNGARPSLDLRA
ncbi:MAG: SCO family protein [Chloroflexi bacterium]|nr:SCO family protein [Chloroflexota bacterium]